jgi:pyrimidine-nucleoside phosphorylase
MRRNMTAALAPVQLLERSRRGEPIDAASVAAFVRGWLDGTVTDAQMGAWCMAACLAGLRPEAVAALTEVMVTSGDRLDLGRLGPTGDAHSTGGVGDATTLVAMPLAAALGVRVAKMSGRGLAHTGGTIDKLEAIPGFRTELALDRFVRQVRDVGIAVIGQTARMTPADKRLYALRDQTGTVPSTGLIAASIMSKKIAGGAGAIALDVKAGAGAFFPDAAAAREAAGVMADLAVPWGRTVRWMVTAMDQPLGRYAGNALEVRGAGEVLRGEGAPDLRELSLRVAAELAEAAGVEPPGNGRAAAEAALASGAALLAAERWAEAQGGDPRAWTEPGVLAEAPLRLPVPAPADGHLAALDALAVGEAARWLGAGRLHAAQAVDPAVGVEMLAKVGDAVTRGQPVVLIHARDAYLADRAVEMVAAGVRVEEGPVAVPELVLDEG